jgi:hypothetical protein
MSESHPSETAPTGVPVWFWIVSGLALLWNAFGLFDFYNSVSLNQEYLAAYPGYIEFIQSMPVWAMAGWGMGVSLSVVGSALLLLRKTWAFHAYAIAIFGMIVSFGYQLTSDMTPDGDLVTTIMTGVIWVIAFALVWFAKMATKKGWLS